MRPCLNPLLVLLVLVYVQRILQSCDLNCVFMEFSMRLFCPVMSRSAMTLPSCSLIVDPCIRMSSAIPMTPGSSLINLSNLSWNTSLVTFNPKGSLSYQNLPHGVLKIVSRLDCRSRITCQYPDVASFRVIAWPFERCGNMTSNVLEYHWFLSIALFRSLGSRHSLMLSSGFNNGTIEWTNSVCWLTSVMMSSHISLSNSALKWDVNNSCSID